MAKDYKRDDTWPEAAIAMLIAMWPDPKNSTAIIGRAVGFSKNAVAGKAGRIGLPARPSPIKMKQGEPGAEPARARRFARGESTLPPLPSLS